MSRQSRYDASFPALEKRILATLGITVVFRLDPTAEVFADQRAIIAALKASHTVSIARKKLIELLADGGFGHRGQANNWILNANHIVFIGTDGRQHGGGQALWSGI